jgi:hypothetical protein
MQEEAVALVKTTLIIGSKKSKDWSWVFLGYFEKTVSITLFIGTTVIFRIFVALA